METISTETRKMSSDLWVQYERWMEENERSRGTIRKYGYYLALFQEYLGGRKITRREVIRWKEVLKGRFSPGTVNGALAAVNSLFAYCGWKDLQVRLLKVGRKVFCESRRELTKNEYLRLVRAARDSGNERLALLLQTVCSTGIRISELAAITVEAACARSASVDCKGKIRTVFLPEVLCRLLRRYADKRGIRSGQIFVTRGGRPLDRSNIWRDMKKLSQAAGVEPEKIFPHNLRHLFARTYYSQERDLLRLSDILGHSDINTTRIYTRESGADHLRRLEQLGLAVEGEKYNRITLLL